MTSALILTVLAAIFVVMLILLLFRGLRDDLRKTQADIRMEMSQQFALNREGLEKSSRFMSDMISERVKRMEQMQMERLQQMEKGQNILIKRTDERLEHIRVTVEEKLDKTLADRLGKSFETVGKQLI
ncbi:MAG: hypothetical protein IKU18_01735, partial [Bacteroidales bacterium]|nr:hypothetical protein [Bacteroidales bacterium]